MEIDKKASEKPTEIEKKRVYEVYDKIYKPCPQVAEFLNSLEKDSYVLDVGCGNGKYLSVNENLNIFGTDCSGNLLFIAKDKNLNSQFFVADSLKLPISYPSFFE